MCCYAIVVGSTASTWIWFGLHSTRTRLFSFPKSLHVGTADGFVEFLTNEMPRFVRTQHFLGNSLIEFDGPEVAYVETYLHADHQGSERAPLERQLRQAVGAFISTSSRSVTASGLSPVESCWLTGCISTPLEGWFDDHPDASGRRDATDPALRKVAGVRRNAARPREATVRTWPRCREAGQESPCSRTPSPR